MRRALVVAQCALAIVLLVGAGLLIRSWWFVNSIGPGFRPERVLVMKLSTPTTLGAPAQRTDLYRRVLEQIQAVTGVESAGIIGDLFIANTRSRWSLPKATTESFPSASGSDESAACPSANAGRPTTGHRNRRSSDARAFHSTFQ
jgi:hypothetical protein